MLLIAHIVIAPPSVLEIILLTVCILTIIYTFIIKHFLRCCIRIQFILSILQYLVQSNLISVL